MTTALRIQGWTLTGDPAAAVAEVLGAATAEAVEPPATWAVEDSIAPDDPIGAIRSLVVVAAEAPCRAELVPGSQGNPPPPPGAARAVRTVEVGPGSSLVMDGRCWYRVPDPGGARVQVFFRPRARTES
ncbi:MAG TPA: hypothetical protein VFJ16_19015 [Longimicrobium sp.]|nr:hypothetical protein [Longimicrobium sp.]